MKTRFSFLKSKYLLAVLFFSFFSYSLSPETFLCDGTWFHLISDHIQPSSDYLFKTHTYSWGIGKSLSISLKVDSKTNLFTEPDCFINYEIVEIEKIEEFIERVVISSTVKIRGSYVTNVESLILHFTSNDTMLIFFESELENIDEIPKGPYNLKYLRISGPTRIPVKNAVLNDSRVRCRTEPNLNCETWGYLNTGDKVLIKDISNAPFEIDGESWYWYKVESDSLPDGWVYGKYLDIEE